MKRKKLRIRQPRFAAHLLARALLLGQCEVSVELLEADALEDAFRVIGWPEIQAHSLFDLSSTHLVLSSPSLLRALLLLLTLSVYLSRSFLFSSRIIVGVPLMID